MTPLGCALALIVAGVPSPTAWAPPPPIEAPQSDAAKAFAAGETAFDAGDFDAAAEAFARAQELLPHPHTAYNLGLAQARAGRALEAWATFEMIRDTAFDPEQRVEAELQLARLAPKVARVSVHASQGQVVRVNGVPIALGEVRVRPPGPVRIDVDAHTLEVELEGGELRHVDVRATPAQRIVIAPHRAMTGVLAATLVAAAGATGTGTAAAMLGSARPGRPLAYTAAGLGGTAVVLATTALTLHLRTRAAARRASRP